MSVPPVDRIVGRTGRCPSRAILIVVCLVAVQACGGGGSNPPPTSPTPPPSLPPGGVCDALGGSASSAILNGTACSSERSAVVLLNTRDRDGFAAGACSGTVISSRAILTAAHCIPDGTGQVRVWLGSGSEIPARSFTRHPNYRSSSSTEDVGIVFMDQDLGRTQVPLLLSRDARVGEPAIVAGWGRDQDNVPATLRAGVTAITAASATLLETQYGSGVSSVCSGDSGGPILVSEGSVWAIAGVTSATSENVCNTGTNFYVAVRNTVIWSFVTELVPDATRR